MTKKERYTYVINWFQENMRPAGVKTNHQTLDDLHTTRPIVVWSSFGHTALANTRALKLANITKLLVSFTIAQHTVHCPIARVVHTRACR